MGIPNRFNLIPSRFSLLFEQSLKIADPTLELFMQPIRVEVTTDLHQIELLQAGQFFALFVQARASLFSVRLVTMFCRIIEGVVRLRPTDGKLARSFAIRSTSAVFIATSYPDVSISPIAPRSRFYARSWVQYRARLFPIDVG